MSDKTKTDLRLDAMWMTIRLQKSLAPVANIKVDPPLKMAESIFQFLSKDFEEEEPKEEFKVGITNGK